MKKRILSIVSVLCLMAMIFALTSCQNDTNTEGDHDGHSHDDSSKIVYHTITFNSNGGSHVDSIKIQHGHYVDQLETPVYNNHVFLHWNYQGSEWLYDYKAVKEDMNLTAVWVAADALFGVAPFGDGIEITSIKRQEEFKILLVPSIINGKTVTKIGNKAFESKAENYAKNIVFPESVTEIGTEAFKDVSSMNLTFKGKITSIGESAFENCSSLASITLAPGMKSIPFSAFASCSALQFAQIPNGVETIEENAYEKCSSLKMVILPKSVTTIEHSAFLDCSSLTSVFYEGTEEEFDKIDIDQRNEDILDAKIYFYSEVEPTTQGNFWCYNENNSPVLW